MERGFIKLWNKIKDNRSYSRGGVHRAILMTLFAEVNRFPGFFRGVEILPGQWATSILGLSSDLGFPRTTVQRALSDLVSDGVITVQNMGNKWTLISFVNWHVYQVKNESVGQPVGNQWATSGQPVGTIIDIKNKDIKKSIKDTNVSLSFPHEKDEQAEESVPRETVPVQRILDMYREELPFLRQPRMIRTNVAASIKARWHEKKKEGKFADEEGGLAYFRHVFRYVSQNAFLSGRKTNWKADFEWIVKAANWDKITTGKYAEDDGK